MNSTTPRHPRLSTDKRARIYAHAWTGAAALAAIAYAVLETAGYRMP